MAVTPVGNPYVESSDLVANYPGASEALAERIDIVGVNPFADSAARATAIPSPTEGMMSSLNDTDNVWRYDGATWKPVGGKVLQVVSATYSTSVSSTTTAWVTTGLTATITPSSASSKILILAHTGAGNAKNNDNNVGFTLFRGTVAGTNLGNATAGMSLLYAASTITIHGNQSFNYLDSPSTVSAQVYTLAMKSLASGNTVISSLGGALSSITLMEVAA